MRVTLSGEFMTTVATNNNPLDRILNGSFNSQSSTAAGQSSGNVSAMAIAQTAYDVASILSSNASAEQKAQAAKERVGLAVADYYTAGAASAVYGFAQKQWPGTMAKLSEWSAKLDPAVQLIGQLFGSKNMWKTEGNRTRELLEQGVRIPESLQAAMNMTRGRSKEELIDPSVAIDFRGYKEDGQFVNNLFANSRDVKDLVAEDIWGYSAFFEKFGNDWLEKFTPEQRYEIANKALEMGKVDEHHGTIDIKWDAEFDAAIAGFISDPSTATRSKTDFGTGNATDLINQFISSIQEVVAY